MRPDPKVSQENFSDCASHRGQLCEHSWTRRGPFSQAIRAQPKGMCRFIPPFTSWNSWTLCFTTLLRKQWATSWLFVQHSCSLFEGFSPSDFQCFYKVFKLGNHIWYAKVTDWKSNRKALRVTSSQELLSKLISGREWPREKASRTKGRHWLY